MRVEVLAWGRVVEKCGHRVADIGPFLDNAGWDEDVARALVDVVGEDEDDVRDCKGIHGLGEVLSCSCVRWRRRKGCGWRI